MKYPGCWSLIGLQPEKPPIRAVAEHKPVMVSRFDDTPVFHRQDHVGVTYG